METIAAQTAAVEEEKHTKPTLVKRAIDGSLVLFCVLVSLAYRMRPGYSAFCVHEIARQSTRNRAAALTRPSLAGDLRSMGSTDRNGDVALRAMQNRDAPNPVGTDRQHVPGRDEGLCRVEQRVRASRFGHEVLARPSCTISLSTLEYPPEH